MGAKRYTKYVAKIRRKVLRHVTVARDFGSSRNEDRPLTEEPLRMGDSTVQYDSTIKLENPCLAILYGVGGMVQVQYE
jgi:hypothetical protein